LSLNNIHSPADGSLRCPRWAEPRHSTAFSWRHCPYHLQPNAELLRIFTARVCHACDQVRPTIIGHFCIMHATEGSLRDRVHHMKAECSRSLSDICPTVEQGTLGRRTIKEVPLNRHTLSLSDAICSKRSAGFIDGLVQFVNPDR